MKFLIPMAAILFAISAAAMPDDPPHHEDLTTFQLGSVHFPTSCDAKQQANFERGVALLHSFWYDEVEKQFTQIAKDDPKCAMAHWGIAMGLWHQLWDHPDEKVIAQGLSEVQKAESLAKSGATQRERDYITAIRVFYSDSKKWDHEERAVAYSNAMEKLHNTYPEDREATAFYGLSLLASQPEGDTTFANRKKAASVLEVLFAEEPNHPGVAHYLIHSYDKPQLAELGLPAARRYAQIAPSSPHALHMPSHIFARLGLWQDDINSNLASIAATRKTAAMHMGEEDHQFHAMDFLVYAYLQSGREADAQAVLNEVKTMPDKHEHAYDERLYSLSAFPARIALEQHRWQDAAALQPVAGAEPGDQAYTYWARAIGNARMGNKEQARKDVTEIEKARKTYVEQKKAFFADTMKESEDEAQAWINHDESKNDEAIQSLRSIAEKSEARGEAPGDVPTREMLGDLLMEMNRPADALAEYEMELKFNPGRFNGLYGAAHSAELAGKNDEARKYFAELVESCKGSNSSRAELVEAKQLVASK
jgi:hypothetical protein